MEGRVERVGHWERQVVTIKFCESRGKSSSPTKTTGKGVRLILKPPYYLYNHKLHQLWREGGRDKTPSWFVITGGYLVVRYEY